MHWRDWDSVWDQFPFQRKKQVEKNYDRAHRGDVADIFNEDLTVAVWLDNKPVYVASNLNKVRSDE